MRESLLVVGHIWLDLATVDIIFLVEHLILGH